MQKHGAELTLKQKNHNMAEPSEHNRFFKPYEGDNYKDGINGKKILVVGASFYCTEEMAKGKGCIVHTECTNPKKKDSSDYNFTCPAYKGLTDSNGNPLILENEPKTAMGEDGERYEAYSYDVFECFLKLVTDINDNPWDYVAFTNYVQFMVPTKGTQKSYLDRERDFNAFYETLIDLQPHVVITWGTVFNDDIRMLRKFNTKYKVDKDELEKSDYYLCHIKIKEVPYPIALINTYHPSSRAWSRDLCKAIEYTKMALLEDKK